MEERLEFKDLFPIEEDYPGKYIAEEGVPQGAFYSDISTTYLNGVVNYINPFTDCGF